MTLSRPHKRNARFLCGSDFIYEIVHVFAVSKNRVGELAETVSNVKFINVHELGSDKTRRPEKVADHANFLAADMIVAVSSQVWWWCQEGQSESLVECENDLAVDVQLTHQMKLGVHFRCLARGGGGGVSRDRRVVTDATALLPTLKSTVTRSPHVLERNDCEECSRCELRELSSMGARRAIL